MKKNVTKTESKDVKGMFWYSWDEYCDRCGEQVWKCGEMQTLKNPDLDEKDYCVKCLEELLENRIRTRSR